MTPLQPPMSPHTCTSAFMHTTDASVAHMQQARSVHHHLRLKSQGHRTAEAASALLDVPCLPIMGSAGHQSNRALASDVTGASWMAQDPHTSPLHNKTSCTCLIGPLTWSASWAVCFCWSPPKHAWPTCSVFVTLHLSLLRKQPCITVLRKQPKTHFNK